jgi:hypothetical protein
VLHQFGRQFKPWNLYKYVSGLNAVRLRKLLSTQKLWQRNRIADLHHWQDQAVKNVATAEATSRVKP